LVLAVSLRFVLLSQASKKIESAATAMSPESRLILGKSSLLNAVRVRKTYAHAFSNVLVTNGGKNNSRAGRGNSLSEQSSGRTSAADYTDYHFTLPSFVVSISARLGVSPKRKPLMLSNKNVCASGLVRSRP
jgi:hypothetical protein